MKTCPEHNKLFSPKSPNKGGYYWHVINFDKDEYCSKSKEAYDAIPGVDEESQREPLPDGVTQGMPQRTVDTEARGKTRCQVAVAFIKVGASIDNQEEMEKWVDYIMFGPKN